MLQTYYYPPTGVLVGFFLMWMLCIGLCIGVQICLGVAAYSDAKSKMNTNAVMWGVLVGVLGVIPGIIYLCLRNNPTLPTVSCQKCGLPYAVTLPSCPRCGLQNAYAGSAYHPDAPKQAKRAKTLLIVAICLFAAAILTIIIGVCALVASAAPLV